MSIIEPTYLRYVYDSLNKGSLNAENAAALPTSLIGLYEQEFSQDVSVHERQELIEKLAIWALFKGPVSTSLAAGILDIEHEQMKNLIDRFSSWFNSPESGKYQLYHERLRVYLLQKLKPAEVQNLNEKLISYLEDGIKDAKGEEVEYYALEYLHHHMALESQLGNHYKRLHSYVNQESLWKRQIQLSKGFSWCQNAVQQGIKEGARRNHVMNTIRSSINSLKLMTQEQNSAQDILNLLNEGDYPTALKRAETWEGERQFKLYLLFIHELTIGTSKEADFRKEACKAILEAIDQTPQDQSVLDWTKFYPELAIYKYHVELDKLGLDGMVIWGRGNYTLKDLVLKDNADVLKLLILASEIADVREKSKTYAVLSKLLLEQGDKEKSLQLASEIPNGYSKCLNYLDLYKILKKQGDTEGAKFASRESFVSISELHLGGYDEASKSKLYADLSKVLIEYGDKEGAKSAVKESLNVMKETSDWDFTEDYAVLLKVVMEQGGKKESVRMVSEIPDNRFYKSKVYADLSKILFDQGDNEGSKSAVKESLRMISKISDEYDYTKNWASVHLSKVLMEQGDKEESLRMISEIPDEYDKFEGYVCLSKVLIDQGNKEESLRLISEMKRNKSEVYEYLSRALMEQRNKEESFKVASKLSNNKKKFKVYADLSMILLDQGDNDGAKSASKVSFISASEIHDNYSKSMAFAKLFKLMLDQGDNDGAKSALKESLHVASKIRDEYNKSFAYANLSKVLIEQGDYKGVESILKESLNVNSEIKYDKDKSIAYREISKKLLEQGDKEKSLQLASEIPNGYSKCLNYLDLYKILKKQGDTEGAKFASRESFVSISELHLGGYDEASKSKLYADLSKVLIEYGDKEGAKSAVKESLNVMKETSDWDFTEDYAVLLKVVMEQGGKKESVRMVSEIPDNRFYKSKVYADLSKILFDQGDNKGVKSAVRASLDVALKLSDDWEKSEVYEHLSKVLMEQGDKEESLRVASEIPDDYAKFKTHACLSKILMEQGNKEESLRMISGISGWQKSEYYEHLSKVLMEQGDKEESLRVASEITDGLIKSKTYAVLSKLLMERGDKKESLKVASEITDDREKSKAFKALFKALMEYGDNEVAIFAIKESLRVAADIQIASNRLEAFCQFGKTLSFELAQNILQTIPSEENKNAVILGMSENINEQMVTSKAINPYLYNYSEITQNLSNTLYQQARIVCFFEKESNEEKLDMLSEVLDIKDWRRISANMK